MKRILKKLKINTGRDALIVLGYAIILFILTGLSYYYYQNNLSRDAQTYWQELNIAKIHESLAENKPAQAGTKKIPILVYHGVGPFYLTASKHLKTFGVEPENFEKHLKYLQDNGYTTISFDQLSKSLKNNGKLPTKPVIITFDDGWKNQYAHAQPLLKKYNFTATFFIPVKQVGEQHKLDWRQVKELSDAGMTIGSHSKTHPFLTDATVEELKYEIVESKQVIEERLQKPVTAFAYPYGDYNDDVIKVLEGAGYTSARTTDIGNSQKKEDIYKLKGNLIFNTTDIQKILKLN